MFNLLDTINLISVSQLLFFIILLIFKAGQTVSWKILFWFLIAQLLSYGNYFLFRFGTEETQWGYLLTAPAGFMVTPLYYWYIRSRLFRSALSFRRAVPHALPALISFWLVLLDIFPFHIKTKLLAWLSEYPVFNTALNIQILCYNLSAWILLRRYQSQFDRFYSSRNFKSTDWIAFLIYSYCITATLIGALEIIFPLNKIMIVSYGLFWIFLNVIYLKVMILPVDIAGVEEDNQVHSAINEDNVLSVFPAIEQTIREEKLYLNPDLTLRELSQKLKIPDRTLSQVIRQRTGRNFCDFVNAFRIEYAKLKMLTPENKGLTILEILYDSGFNSKSVFNFQFRKFTGKSPLQFKKDYFDVIQRTKKES
jgi:AraC-like DNA-binding protein